MLNKNLITKLNKNTIGRKFLNYIISKEGGEKNSFTLREQMKIKNIDIGLYSYGGCFANGFNNGGKVIIGRYCSFASYISYFGGNHPVNYASMSPYFYNKNFSGFDVKDIYRETLTIGNDVWIGQNVLITNKCKNIGNGAVIGAGSVVTKDVPPYSIVAGNPAKVIKYRFDDETIKMLEKSKWWELEPNQIMEYYDVIDNPLEFAKRIIKGRNL